MSILRILLVFIFFAAVRNAGASGPGAVQRNSVLGSGQQMAADCLNKKDSKGFEENKGQFLDFKGRAVQELLFKTSSAGVDLYVTHTGLSYVFLKAEKKKFSVLTGIADNLNTNQSVLNVSYCRVDMQLEGANILPENIGRDQESEDHLDFYLGEGAPPILNVKRYQQITVKNVYQNIDWVIYLTNNGDVKYDFIVHPGGDIKQIALNYVWADAPNKKEDGTLSIATPLGKIIEGIPYSYLSGTEREIKSSYAIDPRTHAVHFNIADYDKSQTLVIDPQLIWGTYYGNTSINSPRSAATDKSGNLFVTGFTYSTAFPTLNPGGGAYFQGTVTGAAYDAFVLKFTNAGKLLWSTYYGGSGSDAGSSIATDAVGNVYVTGSTGSTNFPILNAGGSSYFQGTLNGTDDVFILKFNNSGLLLWASYYGGSQSESGNSIAVDSSGNIFITGETSSTDLPIINPGSGAYYQASNAGMTDIIIVKFNNLGTLAWATYYGGSFMDDAYAITADIGGNIFITGETLYTTGTANNFPTFNPGGSVYYQGTSLGSLGQADMYLLKFSATSVLLWSTYYAGTQNDVGTALTTDATGNLFVTGYTWSFNFPTLNPGGGAWFQGSLAGKADVFILKFNNSGVCLWATFYGGSNIDESNVLGDREIALDGSGNVYVTGSTFSTDFPTLDPGCTYYNGASVGSSDIFILKFSNGGTRLWATYNGSSAFDLGTALALDANNCLFVVGEWNGTASNGLNDPGGGAYYNATFTSSEDGFIMKFCDVGSALTVGINSTNPSCSGPCTGIATANPIGCSTPYTYSWNTGSTTATVSSLCSGTYTVTVSDAVGTTASSTVTLLFTSAPTTTATAQPADCGIANGSALSIPSGGSGTYTYAWSNGQTAQTATGLAAAVYTVTIFDSGGCSATTIVTVKGNNAGTSSIATFSNVKCNGGTDGSAIISITGGTAPYTWLWSNGGTGVSATGLSAATYTCTVTDVNGCSSSTTVTLTQPTLINLNPNSTAEVCGGVAGSAFVSVSGGVPSYSYLWTTGATGATAVNLVAGNYTVTVTDSNGCSKISSTTVATGGGFNSAISLNSPILCFSQVGAISVAATGGSVPYTFSWSNGVSSVTNSATDQLTSLIADTYSVTITDSKGCSSISTIVISEPPVISLQTFSTNATCGQNNGSINSILSGGTKPYFYSWSDGTSSSVSDSLAPGNYSVTVTDAQGCTTVSTSVINANLPDSLTITPATQTILEGASVAVTVTGGTSYTWLPSTGLSCTNCSNLVAAPTTTTTYTIIASDGNGCPITALFTIVVKHGCTGDDKDVFVPTVFSPNNDGQNDVLKVEGNGLKNLYWAIYDRWGNLLFETNDQSHAWDGSKNGNAMETGTYVYYLKAVCITTDAEIRLKGNVSILK